jgi:hypothetical protein
MYKHYLRLTNNIVTQAFSSAFEQPQEGDVLIYEGQERHCQFQTHTQDFLPKYRYESGELLEIDHTQERKRRGILSELDGLDAVLPRWAEDTIEKGKLHEKYKTAIARKEALRLELKGL